MKKKSGTAQNLTEIDRLTGQKSDPVGDNLVRTWYKEDIQFVSFLSYPCQLNPFKI